jgi:hypothetical protein
VLGTHDGIHWAGITTGLDHDYGTKTDDGVTGTEIGLKVDGTTSTQCWIKEGGTTVGMVDGIQVAVISGVNTGGDEMIQT